jgi:pyruvate/2-oxoacid:ferredoxin oxidoreductase beta subunit
VAQTAVQGEVGSAVGIGLDAQRKRLPDAAVSGGDGEGIAIGFAVDWFP